jgi:MFS family permease
VSNDAVHAASAGPRRLWNRFFVILSIAAFTTAIGQSLLMAALPIYVVYLGSNAAFGGTLTMIFSISALVGRLFMGGLSDTLGRHRIMVIGAGVFGLATIAFRLTDSLALMALLRCIQASASLPSPPPPWAAVVDVTPKAKLAEGIGYYGLGQTVSTAIGPSIALALIGVGLYKPCSTSPTWAYWPPPLLLWFCSYERHPDYRPEPKPPILRPARPPILRRSANPSSGALSIAGPCRPPPCTW